MSRAYAAGFRSIAILLMHGYRFSDHEKRLAAIAKEIGFPQISVSHDVSPLMKLVSPRRHHRGRCLSLADPAPLREPGRERDRQQDHAPHVHAVEWRPDRRPRPSRARTASSPARPAASSARCETARQGRASSGSSASTWAAPRPTSRITTAQFERSYEAQVAGVRMRAPMMQIHTVAAGGGSILHFDGSRFRVGPDPAGADPGPAAYRRDGPLTVTDCNVMLGPAQPRFLPEGASARTATSRSTAPSSRRNSPPSPPEISKATGEPRTPEAVAEGFLMIAVANMANAIKEISIQRGYDVTQYTLACFGGAGGQARLPASPTRSA